MSFPNTLTLIKILESTPNLDGKFDSIKVISRDPVTGAPQVDLGKGSLSVVFKARNIENGRDIAIKFFDPDFSDHRERYRQDSFDREYVLLERLKNKERCIQLEHELSQLELKVTDAQGNTITRNVSYFSIEWIENSAFEYFTRQQDFDAKSKLVLFRNIVLAVNSIHLSGIYHRDLKPDNFRLRGPDINDIVVAIDFNTSCAKDLDQLGNRSDYEKCVGALMYAPIETLFGLSYLRELALYADCYALGCMLFELFNDGFFLTRQWQDTGYQACHGNCTSHMLKVNTSALTNEDLKNEWRQIIQRNKQHVSIPEIPSTNPYVPNALVGLLNELISKLTNIDYKDRLINFNKIIRYVDSAQKILNYEELYQRRLTQKRRHRAKIAQKEKEKVLKLKKKILIDKK